MIDADLQRRVRRLLQGGRRIDDLDRLFLALRDRSYGRASIREIGDFVAHRDQRVKGPVTQQVRDVFTSLASWVRISVDRRDFTLADIRTVSAANLRIATDEQIKARLGLTRSVAKSVLEQALRKAERKEDATDREKRTVDYFGSAFIWNPAFTDEQVLEDLAYVLGKTGLQAPADQGQLAAIAPLLALYVLTLMHGSAVRMEDGGRAELVAGYNNKEARLEVKTKLVFAELNKPIITPLCIFWTALHAPDHCTPALLADPGSWEGPLEIGEDGRLTPIA